MGEKKATRAVYGEMLVELAEKYPELVVLDADLSSATMTKSFAKAYPDRFLDMGIAEANMIGVAAGLSTCGKKPFANSFAMFTAGRAYEQVRNSVAYPHLNVKCVGSHGGLSVGEDGATHQCLEDLALMSAIPGMTVVNPCDGNEMRQAVLALIEYNGPAYLRLGRMAVETVTDTIDGYKFELGKAAMLRDGKDVTIAATGLMVQRALAAAELLSGVAITDEASLRAAADALLATGLHRVFISLGGDGVFAADRSGERVHLPVLPAEMVNTTGCGDAFMAAITWAYLAGTDLTGTAKAGLAASAIAMEGAETINPAMSEGALRQRMAQK